jgi:uncharacterized membrane protein YcaP (DUF421 family)
MNGVLELSMPWWSFALRGAGKRSFGEMSAFDVVVIALAGGTLRTAIIGDDHGMLGPFIGVAAILATDKTIGFLSARSPGFNRLMEGFPTVLIRDGKRDPEALRDQNLPDAALDRALHGAGIELDEDVETGRLEPNGRITLVRRKTRAN